jgi:hypothetical protein
MIRSDMGSSQLSPSHRGKEVFEGLRISYWDVRIRDIHSEPPDIVVKGKTVLHALPGDADFSSCSFVH